MMRVIVEALSKSSELALWIIKHSGDKELVTESRNVLKHNNLACDEIVEMRRRQRLEVTP